jgi:hypothetical protein
VNHTDAPLPLSSPTALSNLICASLTEDPYGVAQRDIPKILEAFVRYLSVLDGVAAELEAVADKTLGPPEEKERARKVVEKEVGEVQEGAFAFSFLRPSSLSLFLLLPSIFENARTLRLRR